MLTWASSTDAGAWPHVLTSTCHTLDTLANLHASTRLEGTRLHRPPHCDAKHLGASCHTTTESIHNSAQTIYETLQHHVSSEA